MDIYANVIEMGTRYEINYHINEEANFTGISYPRCYRVGEVTPLVTPNRPYKYEFTGWYYNGELITEISDTMYGDIDLYDSWVDKNTYIHINYEDDSANSYSFEPTTVLIEGSEYYLPYPKKEGYFFNGWYLDTDYTKRVYKIDDTIHSDVTLYAKYSKKTKANTYVSFVGDSISSYAGLIPEDAGFYYPTYVNFPPEHTYFLLTCNEMGFNFLKNDSYAGSRLSSTVVQGELVLPPAISDKRIAGLTDGVHDPDILILHIGNNDYLYDSNKRDFYNPFDKGNKENLQEVIENSFFCIKNENNFPTNNQIDIIGSENDKLEDKSEDKLDDENKEQKVKEKGKKQKKMNPYEQYVEQQNQTLRTMLKLDQPFSEFRSSKGYVVKKITGEEKINIFPFFFSIH